MNPTTSTKYDNEGYSTNKKKEDCEKSSCMNIKPVIDNQYYTNSIQNLCMLRKWEMAKYDLVTNVVADKAGNHNILHTAICSTMIYKSTGYGRNKKVARNEAARKMYEQIINLSKDEIDNTLQHCEHKIPGPNVDNKETLKSFTSPGILKIVRELFDRLQQYNTCLKNLKELDSFENISAIDMLNTIAVEEGLSLTYNIWREKIRDEGKTAEINIFSGMVFVGIG